MKRTNDPRGRRVALACGFATLALGAGGGCTLSFEADGLSCEGRECTRQAADASSCGGGPCDEPPRATACLGHVTTRAPGAGAVTQSIALQSLTQLTPVAGVVVRSCQAADLYCEDSLGAATTGTDGLARLEVPAAAWGGYFEYAAPNSMTSIVHFEPAYEGGGGGALVRTGLAERSYWGPVASFEMLAQVGSASGAPFALEPSLGFIFGKVVGCDGEGLPGVDVTVDMAGSTTAVVYAADGLPSASMTSTGPAGDFYVGNVPADRFAILRARLADGRALGERRAVSRAGAITVVTVGPSEGFE
jgi:hypothetical protein